jgi:peptide/nickel transport system permease protein
VLVIIFSLNLGLFPATGFIPITESVTGWLSTIVLPVVAIALGPTLALAVWIRSSIIDMRRQDWVRTLRARGISQRAIMYRHVLRNAAAPTVQILGLMVIGLISGTIIVERIFALPGVGTMALSSGLQGDIPVVLGAITFLVVVVVVVNLAVDVINGLLNPKARVS